MGLPSTSIFFKREDFYDFSGSGYCPQLDVYLASKCLLIVNGACGYKTMADIFKKPTLMTHAYRLRLSGLRGLVLPSRYRLSDSDLVLNKVLTLDMKAHLQSGVTLLHPSDQEILDAGKQFVKIINEFQEDYPYQNIFSNFGRFAVANGISFADSWQDKHIRGSRDSVVIRLEGNEAL